MKHGDYLVFHLTGTRAFLVTPYGPNGAKKVPNEYGSSSTDDDDAEDDDEEYGQDPGVAFNPGKQLIYDKPNDVAEPEGTSGFKIAQFAESSRIPITSGNV